MTTNPSWLLSGTDTHQGCVCPEKKPCGDTSSRWPSTSQGKGLKTTNHPTTLSWTSNLQNCEEIVLFYGNCNKTNKGTNIKHLLSTNHYSQSKAKLNWKDKLFFFKQSLDGCLIPYWWRGALCLVLLRNSAENSQPSEKPESERIVLVGDSSQYMVPVVLKTGTV